MPNNKNRSNPASHKLHNGPASPRLPPSALFPFAVPMEQIGNHINASGRIYVTGADGGGQGSRLPLAQRLHSGLRRGQQYCPLLTPRPRVIFSGDYNTPPLSQRNARVPPAARQNNNVLSLPFCGNIFFLYSHGVTAPHLCTASL